MARKFNISGTLKLQDEENFGPNEKKSISFFGTSNLSDDQLEEVLSIEEGLGGEVRGELAVTAQLLTDERIRVGVGLLLYEGTSEATSDLDGQKHDSFVLNRNQIVSKSMTAWNTDEGDDDYASVSFTCKNVPV